MSADPDRDEQVSRLAVYESARDAAAQRALVTAYVLGALDELSAEPVLMPEPVEPAWADLFGEADPYEQAYEQLLTSEAVYREAGAAIATPVAQSLLAFLG